MQTNIYSEICWTNPVVDDHKEGNSWQEMSYNKHQMQLTIDLGAPKDSKKLEKFQTVLKQVTIIGIYGFNSYHLISYMCLVAMLGIKVH